LIDRLIDKTS